mgnify:CR=1 FL=1
MSQPVSASSAASSAVQYVGFWARVLASLIDTVTIGFVIAIAAYFLGVPTQFTLDGDGLLVTNPTNPVGFGFDQILTAALVIGFWVWKMATPGKMVISAVIVDAETLGKPSIGQAIGRYLAYFVSIFGLMLGFVWVAFDKRKQGWHDKIAGTLVIKKPV